MRGTLYSFLLILCCNIQVKAQNATVIGFVSDAVTDEPVEIATIYIEGTNRAVETDAVGFFQITVPANEVTKLICSRIGFKETAIDVPSLAVGASVRFDITLAPANSQVEVVVTESNHIW